MDQNGLRRLAFIKGLYGLGRIQSEDRGPLSVAAILTFHDAVELWLRLASETLGANMDSQELMKYWDALEPKVGHPLPGKERIRRLNKARVNLKHYGIMPSHSDVSELRDTTAAFLQEATSLVFQLSFSELSLIDLVAEPQVAGFLQEANNFLASDNISEALDALAKAFHCLRKYLGDQVVGVPGRKPVRIYRTPPPRLQSADRDGSLPQFAKHVDNSLEELRSRLSMLELGVDMSRFRRFSAFVPGVNQTMDGRFHIYRGPGRPAFEATLEEARECFDFLLDTSVRLADHIAAVAGPTPPTEGGA